MTSPVLYSFRRCPYAMRARLALAAAGQTVELREIILRDKPVSMLAASPKGTIPVLILADGTVIDESFDIMQWALAQNDPQGLLAQGRPALDLINRCETEFKPHLDRFKYAARFSDVDREEERALAAKFLVELNTRLNSGHLFGPQISLADIAIAPFVRQFANSDRAWFNAQPWENLHLWLADFIAADRFQRIMSKYPQWQPGDAPTLFPDKTAHAS